MLATVHNAFRTNYALLVNEHAVGRAANMITKPYLGRDNIGDIDELVPRSKLEVRGLVTGKTDEY